MNLKQTTRILTASLSLPTLFVMIIIENGDENDENDEKIVMIM